MSRRTPKLPSWLPVDPYILALLGTVGLAALLPASGSAAPVASGASTGAVALLFFLYGARLSTREAMDGLRHWRLHVTVLACTFVVFPLLGLAARGLVPFVLTPDLYNGLLFLCLVPSTIQSSIAFTSIARGNVPAAICAGSFSSVAGNRVHPAARGGPARQQSASGFSADSLLEIVLQLLVPFLAGQILRRWVGGFPRPAQEGARVRRPGLDPARRLQRVQRGHGRAASGTRSARSGSPRCSRSRPCCWPRCSADLVRGEAARLRPGRPDRDPVRRVEEEPGCRASHGQRAVRPQASLAVLPLMLFHQMQLMVCAVLAKRRARDPLPARGTDPDQEGPGRPGSDRPEPGRARPDQPWPARPRQQGPSKPARVGGLDGGC